MDLLVPCLHRITKLLCTKLYDLVCTKGVPTFHFCIGVGRFRILGGQCLEYWDIGGGGDKGGQIPSRHMTS